MKRILILCSLFIFTLSANAKDYVKFFRASNTDTLSLYINSHSNKTNDDIKGISITENKDGTYNTVVIFEKDD